MSSGPSADFIAMIADMLAPLGDIRAKRMFGGVCFFADGLAFALIADDRLYVKVDGDTRLRHEAEGLPLFQPFADKPLIMKYAAVPDGALEDPDDLLDWARPALAVARRAAVAKPKRARRTKAAV